MYISLVVGRCQQSSEAHTQRPNNTVLRWIFVWHEKRFVLVYFNLELFVDPSSLSGGRLNWFVVEFLKRLSHFSEMKSNKTSTALRNQNKIGACCKSKTMHARLRRERVCFVLILFVFSILFFRKSFLFINTLSRCAMSYVMIGVILNPLKAAMCRAIAVHEIQWNIWIWWTDIEDHMQ